jgi:hypothetical protein
MSRPCGVSATCLLLLEQVRLARLDLSCPFPGVGMARGCELLCSVRLRQEEGVMADLGFNDWPGLLSLSRPRSFGLKLGFSIVGRLACPLFDALKHPGIMTPTVDPEYFCDHKVITEALRCMC